EQKLEARTRELAEARGHLSEALEQQAATSEVLSVISSSPGELEPVFQAMLANAARICEAKFTAMYLNERSAFRTVAMHNAPPALAEMRRRNPVFRPTPRIALARAAATKQTVQIADVQAAPGYLDPLPASVARRSSRSAAPGPWLPYLCSRKTSWSASLRSIARRCGRSPTSKSSWSAILPARPLSRSRIPGCSTSCASARTI